MLALTLTLTLTLRAHLGERARDGLLLDRLLDLVLQQGAREAEGHERAERRAWLGLGLGLGIG